MKRYSAYLFLLLTLFLSAVQAVEMAGWEVMTPRLNKNFYAVWGSASNDVFAVGFMGLILHYDGSQWSEMDSGSLSYLLDIWGTSSTDVFAVGMEGTILHYDGYQWITMDSGTTARLIDIWGSSSTDIFVIGEHGTILHYDGHQWTTMNSRTTFNLHGIWGTSSTDVFAVGNEGTILHYDGHQWTTMNSGTTSGLYKIWGNSNTDVFVVGRYSDIFHYNGHQWTILNNRTDSRFLRGIWINSSKDIFAADNDSTIFHYDGYQWTIMNSVNTSKLFGIWGSSSTDVFAVGLNNIILHYDGHQWAAMDIGSPSPIDGVYGIWGTSDTDMFIVGSKGKILHYDGYRWTAMNSGTTSDLYYIWGTSSTDVFVTGYDNSLILHYDGYRWTTMSSGTTSDLALYGIWGTSSSDVFAVGREGILPHSQGTILHYDGYQWTTMNSKTAYLSGIWGTSSSDVFAVGGEGTILHYDGYQWTAMNSGTTSHLTDIWGTSSNDVFALGYSGIILHYNGHQWTVMNSLTDFHFFSICGSSSTNVFVLGMTKLFHYDGNNWTEITELPRISNLGCNLQGDLFALTHDDLYDPHRDSTTVILRYTGDQRNNPNLQTTPTQTVPNPQLHNLPNQLETANLQINPSSHPFQNVALGQPVSQTFTVTNVSNNTIPLPSLTLTNTTDFTLDHDTCSNTPINPAGTCQVNVNFQPQSEGQKSAKLSLPSNTSSVEVSLDGSGCLNTLEQSFQFSPEPPYFGTIEVNQSMTLNPTIKFTATQGCGEVLQIETIQLAGRDAAEFSLQNIQCSHSHEGKESSSTCQFNLIFKPTSPGDKQADLTFKLLNHEELPSSTIPFSAQAIMADPEPLAVETATIPSEPVSVELMPLPEEESVEKEATTLSPVEVKPALETETDLTETDLEENMIQPTVILPVDSPVNTATPIVLKGITCDAATYTKALETCHLQHIACTYVDNHPATQCDAQKTNCEATARSGCYPLVITKQGAGTGTVQVSNGVGDSFNCDPLCQGQFGFEELVTLTAIADSGSVFQSWSGDCHGESTTTQVTIGSLGINCTAVFEPANQKTQFVLEVTKVGNGTITSTSAQINCDPDCSGNYLAGTAVKLIATPAADFIFTQWNGACSGNSPTVTVTLDADKTCTATFAPVKPYLSTTINCTPNPVASLQKLHCVLTAELSHDAPTTPAKNVKLMTTLPEGLVLTAINTEVGQCDLSQLPQVTCQLNDLNRGTSPTKVTLDLSLQDPNLLAMTQKVEISASNYPAVWARTRTFIAIPPEIQIDLALVIDVNRSMQERINGVKADLEKLITNMTTYQLPLTALIVFKDEVRIKTLTTNRKVLLEAIQSLQTEENNTCPTASAEAVEIAARHLQPGGQIFLGTEAPPYPDADIESILTLLKAKNIHLNTMTIMRDCSMAKS